MTKKILRNFTKSNILEFHFQILLTQQKILKSTTSSYLGSMDCRETVFPSQNRVWSWTQIHWTV